MNDKELEMSFDQDPNEQANISDAGVAVMVDEIKRLTAERDALAALRAQEPVTWGIDWGSHGDQACASIIKKHNDGSVEIVAIEYAPLTNPDAQDAARYRWLIDRIYIDSELKQLRIDGLVVMSGQTIQAAIDAAMKDQK